MRTSTEFVRYAQEMMTSIGALSNIVRSLSREADERREAVGLLLDLSEISKVRQRLGRVQGCIVMLVAMLNGDDPSAACDSGKILGSLSSNTQNVLLMAEAGFFVPLVQYLKEGKDRSFSAISINCLHTFSIYDIALFSWL